MFFLPKKTYTVKYLKKDIGNSSYFCVVGLLINFKMISLITRLYFDNFKIKAN